MQQLELFCTIKMFTPIKQLERHMRMFRVNFTYNELLDWHKKANKLSIEVKEDAIQSKYDNIELPEIDD